MTISIRHILRVFLFVGLVALETMCKSEQGTVQSASGENITAGKNIFRSSFPTTDIKEFEAFARQMERLKPFGRVDVSINNPAAKADFDVPEGRSPWYEYASYHESVHIFFPDEKLAPFLPAEYVKNNRKLLTDKVTLIRKFGFGATWSATDPLFLPETFFEKYPQMRGPRVDHPRRSLHPAFSACFHQRETIEMYQNMVNQLFKNVPEINSLSFWMNDAGSGICWSAEQYTGPNGPTSCKGISISESVVTMLSIYKNAARQMAGHEVDISYSGAFVPEEREAIEKKLKEENIVLVQNRLPSKNASGSLVATWPVRGIINPYQIMRSLNRTVSKPPFRYSMGFGSMYGRGYERLETVEKIVDMVEDNLKNPPSGEVPDSLMAVQALERICLKWGGKESADQLFNSFVALDKALRINRKISSGYSDILYYLAVSDRHITRPLVFAPQNLTPDEERYFLPHVFNVSVDEARNSYTDVLGWDLFLPEGVADSFLVSIKSVYTSIENIKNAPEQKFINDLAKSLHIYSCVVRSCRNFNNAQLIRNRNKEVLAGPVHRPTKIPTDTGDMDLQDFNRIMRDEYDNTQEMINLLENGGMDLVVHAKPPFKEDTFLLGADLIDQLKLKRKIMMTHWRDIEGYLTTPYI